MSINEVTRCISQLETGKDLGLESLCSNEELCLLKALLLGLYTHVCVYAHTHVPAYQWQAELAQSVVSRHMCICVLCVCCIHTDFWIGIHLYIHYIHRHVCRIWEGVSHFGKLHMHTYIHTYIHLLTVYAKCERLRNWLVSLLSYIYIHIHTYIHTYMRTYIHIYIYSLCMQNVRD